MRPLRSFLFLLIFLACFIGLHYVEQVKQLFPSVAEFVPTEVITSLIIPRDVNAPELSFDSLSAVPVNNIPQLDSVHTDSTLVPFEPIKSFIDSLRYSHRQLRIMYYGDSQIEGDRITSYLRHILRKEYGGSGPGLFMPLMPVMYTNSIWLRSSSNWKRYNYLSYKNGEILHKNLGPFMTICRYLPAGESAKVSKKAFVKIKPSNAADSASSVYDLLRVLYGNTNGVVSLSVSADNHVVFSDTLIRGLGVKEISCQLSGAKEILLEFEGKVSPDIYGISIESKGGLILDNIPQRGSAGLEFTMVDKNNLAEAYKILSPDLFILHYGLNVVKNVSKDYSYYQKGLKRQLTLLNEISPATPKLIISLTDMAFKDGDSIKSYPNIPAIINAQKQASLESKVAFWDSYSAMGGEASIIEWVNKKPPLAQNDYTHLTYKGADTLSKLFTDAIFSYQDNDIIEDPILFSDKESDATITYEDDTGNAFDILTNSLFKYDPNQPFIFSSPAFWLFLLVVLAGYSFLYKKMFVRNAYLFLISLFFYYKTGGLLLSLLILVTIIDFICGLLINKSETKFMKRFFLILSLFSNLGILAYFKYTAFFVGVVNDLLGTNYKVYDFLALFSNTHLGTSFNITNILLPVGISFFTFQSLSYIFDVYRRKMLPVRNIIDFGFFVSFFPQLVAGPIVRASEFIPQLYTKYHLSKREFGHAIFLISKGLIKKIIISDFIAVNFIDRVFDTPSIYSGFENLMAVYGYGLQIYCDFSGYTDIAIGLALILGFRLPINFYSPYKAASINDFWKRWHISLSRWLKDYLYIPLGGNRKGNLRTNINLLITMVLGGLWHGASLQFLLWGLLHGIGLIISKLWYSLFGDWLGRSRAGKAIAVFITFQFVSFCWIFFRAPDTESAKIMLYQMFNSFSPGSYITVLPTYSSVFLLIIVGYIIHFLPEKIKESYRGLFIRIPMIAQFVVIMLIGILLYQMRTTEVMPFIYFRF
jgi:alginate O-acetyltransferase complex protein AlgI